MAMAMSILATPITKPVKSTVVLCWRLRNTMNTSGEERISNFMLYRLAYAELVFTEVKWPDFKEDAFVDCLKEFASRHRRFGGLRNA